MNLISTTLFLLAFGCSAAHAQKQELRWGEFGYYSNWDRYSYEIESNYEFIGRLPDLREFPKLLEAALDPKLGESEQVIVTSQMKTLSRCDFEKDLKYGGGDPAANHRAAVSKWKDWWDIYGSKLVQSLEESGKRHEKAWRQISPTPYLECPGYPLSLPKTWTSKISFRSGDYAGVTEEEIEFRVSDGECSLRRRYRTGGSNWTRESWQGFSHDEAEHFLASLIYLIDNPWFFASDKLSEVKGEEEKDRIGHVRGRPKAWSDYYPGYEWTGILDADQRVIINHDPWSWETIDHESGAKTSLDETFGIVFRLVRDLFPDPSWNPDSSKWKRDETDPTQSKE